MPVQEQRPAEQAGVPINFEQDVIQRRPVSSQIGVGAEDPSARKPFIANDDWVNEVSRLFGLATVYGIVQQSDSHIAVDSAPRRGTTVRIYFPPTDRDEPGAPRGHSALRLAAGSPRRSWVRAIVEDPEAPQ